MTPFVLNNLLDGANGDIQELAQEAEPLQKIAANKEYPLLERLEAFEDIFESAVGDTTLVRARNIEREISFRQLYLKFEGSNPTGTQKDRIAFSQAMDAVRRGYDAITVATCGNYGSAIAMAASMAGLKCLIYIPKNYHTNRIKEITDLGAEIIRIEGDYENAVDISRSIAEKEEVYDANPGGANTAIQLQAYGEIAYEIYDELRDAPFACAVPVSNGTTLAGIYKGFLSLYRRGKTSRIPKMIAGSSLNKNPIVQAFIDKKEYCENLVPDQIKETKINEPLINWHSFDGDVSLDAIYASQGWAINASDKKLLQFSKLLREREGLHVLPASTAGLVALLEFMKINSLPNDRYVIILTGRKS